MENPLPTREESRKKFDDTVIQWWREMQPSAEEEGQPNRRGELAELKRCKTLAEVLLVPRFHVLRWRLIKMGCNTNAHGLAATASILAHVKQTTEMKFPVWLAQSKVNGNPRVSRLRFKRLVRSETLDEVFPMLIRVLSLADDTAPIASLAHDLSHWNERTRNRWAWEYLEALLAEEEKT